MKKSLFCFVMLCLLAIADSEGNCAAVEYIDDEMIVIETPVLTNFYLAEGEKNGIGIHLTVSASTTLTSTNPRNGALSLTSRS